MTKKPIPELRASDVPLAMAVERILKANKGKWPDAVLIEYSPVFRALRVSTEEGTISVDAGLLELQR